jgi:hypothetical protein
MLDWLSLVGGPLSLIDGAAIVIASFLTVWRSRRRGRLALLSSFIGLFAIMGTTIAQSFMKNNDLDVELMIIAIASIDLGRIILFSLLSALAISIWRAIFNQIGQRRLFSKK